MSEITEAATGVQPELEALLLLATEPLPVVVLAETVRQPESVVTEALVDLEGLPATAPGGFQRQQVGRAGSTRRVRSRPI